MANPTAKAIRATTHAPMYSPSPIHMTLGTFGFRGTAGGGTDKGASNYRSVDRSRWDLRSRVEPQTQSRIPHNEQVASLHPVPSTHFPSNRLQDPAKPRRRPPNGRDGTRTDA